MLDARRVRWLRNRRKRAERKARELAKSLSDKPLVKSGTIGGVSYISNPRDSGKGWPLGRGPALTWPHTHSPLRSSRELDSHLVRDPALGDLKLNKK